MDFKDFDRIPDYIPDIRPGTRCSLGFVAISKGQVVAIVTTWPDEEARVLAGWIVGYSTAHDLFVSARALRQHCTSQGWSAWFEEETFEAIQHVIARDLAAELLEASQQ